MMSSKINNVILQGLKTGMYYLRTQPAANAIQFTVDKTKTTQFASNGNKLNVHDEEELTQHMQRKLICSRENKEDCLMCSS